MITRYGFLFFFQAEDGIRDIGVTGVQTCALPILQGFNALSAGVIMGFMIVPTIASVSEDAMSAVPAALREGAFGDRKSVVWGKSVDLGGRRIIKKKRWTIQ